MTKGQPMQGAFALYYSAFAYHSPYAHDNYSTICLFMDTPLDSHFFF